MAVRKMIDKKSNEEYFEAYVNLRSNIDLSVRVQKKKKCKTRVEAIRAERFLLKRCSYILKEKENEGSSWRKIILNWETEAKQGHFFQNPLTGRSVTEKTIDETVNMLFSKTKAWLDRPCGELNRADGKDVLVEAIESGLSKGSVKKLKQAIHSVYSFGIERRLIKGALSTPVTGVQLDLNSTDRVPEILTVEQVRFLLSKAEELDHPWYKVWLLAVTTGMRSGELYALRKENVMLNEKLIRVVESWDFSKRTAKSTKAKYWRNTPIAENSFEMIKELISSEGEYLLPRFSTWDGGEQARILREFCVKIGLPSVRFHTLRACFATHMLAAGVNEATIMRIGGWKSFKTFQVYIRLAGVREVGATDKLVELFMNPEK